MNPLANSVLPMLPGALAAALLAAALVGLLVRARGLRGFDDLPNERSMHKKPVGRLGGMGLFGAVALVLVGQVLLAPDLFAPARLWTGAALAMLVLIGLGIGDDRGGLPASLRLVIHMACSATLVILLPSGPTILGYENMPTIVAMGFLTLAVTWLANLYNFMDGSDGIAGLTAVIGFGAYAWLAPPGSALALVSSIIAAAALGFLVWNWSPARIFLGDAGSLPLGWAAGALGLIGVSQQAWPLSTPVLVFFPFIFDASVTMARRAIRKQRFWRPHREHIYQRLILAGFSHRTVAMLYGALMIPGIVTAGTTRYQYPGVLFAIWTVIISVHAGIYLWARRHTRSTPPTT